jgi:hypothetical protein
MAGRSTDINRRRRPPWAAAAAVPLLGVAGYFALWAGSLWATARDPYDSPAATYLVVSITPVLAAAAAAAGAARLLRLRRSGVLAVGTVLGAIALVVAASG